MRSAYDLYVHAELFCQRLLVKRFPPVGPRMDSVAWKATFSGSIAEKNQYSFSENKTQAPKPAPQQKLAVCSGILWKTVFPKQ